VLRRLECIGLFKVGVFQEISAHLGRKKDYSAEEEQEYRNTLNVMDRVVGVETYPVQRHTVGILLLLDFNAVRVVGADFMQGQDVQNHQGEQDDGQCHHVQGKESVQGNTREQVVTTNPGHDVFADDRNRAK